MGSHNWKESDLIKLNRTPNGAIVNERWTDKDVVILREMYLEKKQIPEIATRLNKKEKSIKSKACSLGITHNPDYSEDEKEIIFLHYANSDNNRNFLTELSALLKREKTNISRYAKREGLTKQSRKTSFNIKCSFCGKKDTVFGFSSSRKKFCGNDCFSLYTSKRIKDYLSKNEHPNGFLGKNHTEIIKENQSKRSTDLWLRLTEEQKSDLILKRQKTKEKNGTLVTPRAKTTWKQGWRKIGGYKKYYRSRWEANYARYLEFLKTNKEIADWKHEPKTFWFEAILRGCRSYLPDFLVTSNDGGEVYHEVKGWMDDRSITKLKRMKKYHPTIVIKVIDSVWFKENGKKMSGIIKDWE